MANLLHRLKQKFLSRKSAPTTAIEKKISEYPLSEPKKVVKVVRRRRVKRRCIDPKKADNAARGSRMNTWWKQTYVNRHSGYGATADDDSYVPPPIFTRQ